MALSDILERIEAEAAAEARAILDAAEAEAAELVSSAEAAAQREREAVLAEAERSAREQAATIVANARLAARDALLARKRALAEDALAAAQAAIEQLPDAQYRELIAGALAAVARPGETVRVARADAPRLAGIGALLKSRGVDVEISPEPADVPHGVVVVGDRVAAEVSPRTLAADRREHLLLVAAKALFSGGE